VSSVLHLVWMWLCHCGILNQLLILISIKKSPDIYCHIPPSLVFCRVCIDPRIFQLAHGSEDAVMCFYKGKSAFTSCISSAATVSSKFNELNRVTDLKCSSNVANKIHLSRALQRPSQPCCMLVQTSKIKNDFFFYMYIYYFNLIKQKEIYG